MAYHDYLQAQAVECIRLAVAQPWGSEAGDLLDLALDYSSMASAIAEQAHFGSQTGDETSVREEVGFFGWLTKH